MKIDDDRFRLKIADFGFLSVCIILAVLLRLDFLYASQFVIDSDEAIVGLMAKHILEGHTIPIFYYGQHYMGSLEAMLAAISFWCFGISTWTLQLVPLTCSILLIPIMFFVGRECGGRWAAWMAALLTSVPPVGLVVWSFKARGGFIEIVLLGAIAILITCRWLKSDPFDFPKSIAVGLVLGIGWWVNNQVIYFIVPIGFFIAMHMTKGLIESSRRLHGIWQFLRVSLDGILGFAAGSSLYWIYNIEKGFPSLGMFGHATKIESVDHALGLISTALPILMGAKHFWDASNSIDSKTIIYYLVYAFLFSVVLWTRRKACLLICCGCIDRRRPVELFFIFMGVSCVVFAISTFGWLVQAPRYLLPVYVGLFVISSVAIETIAAWSRLAGGGFAVVLLFLNMMSCYFPYRAVPGEPVVFNEERVVRDHSQLITALERHGITRIRTNYWIGYRLAFETKERVTFVLLQEPHQVRIPEYEVIGADTIRDRMPLVVVPTEAIVVGQALQALGYTFQQETIGGYRLFFDITRDEGGIVAIPDEDLTAASSVGTLSPTKAIDGSLETRWGSGGHQVPGQEFRVELKTPQPVSSIRYELAAWPQDHARGLQVEIERPDGSRKVILDATDYFAVRYFMAENSEFQLLFEPTQAKAVILTQTASHPVFDWSIAELILFKNK